MAQVAGIAIGVDQRPGMLNHAAARVKQLAPGRPDTRVTGKWSGKRRQPLGRDLGVVIKQNDDLAARGQDADVVAARESKVAIVGDKPRRRELLADQPLRRIGRSVIDDDQLEGDPLTR